MSEDKKDTHGVSGEGWYGFDLDGTLAKYDGWKGIDRIGEPVRPMVELIKRMHAEGKTVKILTARVAPRLCGETHATGCKCGRCEEEASKPPVMQEQYLAELGKDGMTVKRRASDYIRDWCADNLGFIPEIVYQKDQLMLELYDDRVKQVVPNEGWLVEDIALSKTRRVETTIVRNRIIDCRWHDRLCAFLLGTIFGAAIITAVVSVLRDGNVPEAVRKLDAAVHEYYSAQESATLRGLLPSAPAGDVSPSAAR